MPLGTVTLDEFDTKAAEIWFMVEWDAEQHEFDAKAKAHIAAELRKNAIARDEEIARLRACRAHPGQTAEESELYWHDQAAQLSKMGDDLRVRVAQLEAALRKIETLALPEPSDTAWAYNIARAALEAK